MTFVRLFLAAFSLHFNFGEAEKTIADWRHGIKLRETQTCVRGQNSRIGNRLQVSRPSLRHHCRCLAIACHFHRMRGIRRHHRMSALSTNCRRNSIPFKAISVNLLLCALLWCLSGTNIKRKTKKQNVENILRHERQFIVRIKLVVDSGDARFSWQTQLVCRRICSFGGVVDEMKSSTVFTFLRRSILNLINRQTMNEQNAFHFNSIILIFIFSAFRSRYPMHDDIDDTRESHDEKTNSIKIIISICFLLVSKMHKNCKIWPLKEAQKSLFQLFRCVQRLALFWFHSGETCIQKLTQFNASKKYKKINNNISLPYSSCAVELRCTNFWPFFPLRWNGNNFKMISIYVSFLKNANPTKNAHHFNSIHRRSEQL